MAKETMNEMKMEPTGWENIFANDTSDKGLMFDHFLIGLFFLMLNFISSLYTLYINPSSDVLVKTFYHSMDFFFYSVDGFFCYAKPF